MPIPGYESFMLPLLKRIADAKEHDSSEIADLVARDLGVTVEERSTLLPSRSQTIFDNRLGWARTYLKKAGLVESTGRGKFRITNRGSEVLQKNPTRVDAKYLRQFSEFREFEALRHPKEPKPKNGGDGAETPEERLGNAYAELKARVADELLERVTQCPPPFFERLVVDLLVAMGYGGSPEDARAVGRTGDGGIDGVIKEDKLGLDVVYIQAKRWQHSVGSQEVQAFSGSLDRQRAKKGVFITSSSFTKDALDYVDHIDKRIILIDGERLTQLMIDYGVGVAPVATYNVKRVDLDYFSVE